jgi:hypothetical protein
MKYKDIQNKFAIKNGRFYGIRAGGEWFYLDESKMRRFIGGSFLLETLESEKNSSISWYTFYFKNNHRIYLPRYKNKTLIYELYKSK